MNINLKLKERRDKINKILKHKRTKVMRKFKQARREVQEETQNPDDVIKSKIEKYKNVEKMIQNFDKKIGRDRGEVEEVSKKGEERKSNQRAWNKNRNNQSNSNSNGNSDSNLPNNSNNSAESNKFIGQKRERKTPEEIEKEKEAKLAKRKKTFKNLNKKTKNGQPVLKFHIEHMFRKIKDKINKGVI